MSKLTSLFRKKIKKYFPEKQHRNYIYSQEGEDAILMRIFSDKKVGFYVDIGAHHPYRFSNTYAFYKKGWKGIVVDPIPGMVDEFSRCRPRDIAIEKGVSAQDSVLEYCVFNEGAINTFDSDLAQERQEKNSWHIEDRIDIKCDTLENIVDNNIPDGINTIDFLSVDVEGFDLEVLRSNNWKKYKPSIVVAECLDTTIDDLNDEVLVQYMRSVGYAPISKAFNSVIFRKNEDK